MEKSTAPRTWIGGWVAVGGFLLLVLAVLGYHVITASGESSVFAAGQCVVAAAALASAAALAYGYQRGLINGALRAMSQRSLTRCVGAARSITAGRLQVFLCIDAVDWPADALAQ